MARQEHVHKFKRHTHKSGTAIFFCTLPDCNKKINPSLTLGKKCICWKCGNEFILTEYSIRLVKPHCEDCHVTKSKKIEEIQEKKNEIKSGLSFLDDFHKLIENKTKNEEDEADI